MSSIEEVRALLEGGDKRQAGVQIASRRNSNAMLGAYFAARAEDPGTESLQRTIGVFFRGLAVGSESIIEEANHRRIARAAQFYDRALMDSEMPADSDPRWHSLQAETHAAAQIEMARAFPDFVEERRDRVLAVLGEVLGEIAAQAAVIKGKSDEVTASSQAAAAAGQAIIDGL